MATLSHRSATPASAAAAQPLDLKQLYTAEDLLELSAMGNQRYALTKGRLTIMSPAGSEHGILASRINARLQIFAEDNAQGYVFAAETGFKLTSKPDTVMAPDAAFVAQARMPSARPTAYFPGPPDLAVEVVSPSDRAAEVQTKIQAWLFHGVQLVWLVEPQSQTVTVYRADGSATLLDRTATLDGEDLLPGFRYALNKLFAA